MLKDFPTLIHSLFDQTDIYRNLIITVIYVAIILILRALVIVSIRRGKGRTAESKLELRAFIRNVTGLLVIVGIGLIWATELKTFAISLVAIAAAIVIATKELILCIMGGLLKSIARPFKIGDRIEIAGHRGDVIDHDFLTTSLIQIGPGHAAHQYTGKRLTIPNSLYLSNVLVNETKRFKYGLHTFTVNLSQSADLQAHRKVLLSAANKVCGEYVEHAQKYLDKIGEIDGLETPTAEPRVSISLPEAGKAALIVRIPIPSLRSAKTEQSILQLYVQNRPMDC